MNPYANIPLNQPNREELIRVLEHIREAEPETFERNVRECCEVVPAPKRDTDTIRSKHWELTYSFWPHQICMYNGKEDHIAIFRIKTRKP